MQFCKRFDLLKGKKHPKLPGQESLSTNGKKNWNSHEPFQEFLAKLLQVHSDNSSWK